MTNELIFIRHAKTKIDKEVPIENWTLTNEGFEQAQEIANSKEFNDVDILISSNELKTYLTIKPLSEKLQKEIINLNGLEEIKRPNSEKLTTEEYGEMKTKIFQNLDFTDNDWETANHALNRFKKVIEEEINKNYSDKKILICSHGTVMTLYFAYISNQLNNLMQKWKDLKFGSHGIIKGSKIIKDIV